MYEELINALRKIEEEEMMEYGVDYYRTEEAADALESLVAQLAALQSENTELKRRLDEINDFGKSQCAKLLVKLARVEAERDAAIADVPHDCEHCKHEVEDGACKLLPDGDQFSPDYTESFDRDGNCDHWEWNGAQGEA